MSEIKKIDDIKYDFKDLTPFKWYVLENFPFIEADFDALTNWQLLCKLGKELNKVIDSQNSVGEQTENLTNAFNSLNNYVNNYFDRLNIQEEINKKLDIMAENGTLSKIINEDIFNELNNKITNIENTKIKNKLFIGVFFELSSPEKIIFSQSSDGINFSDFNNVDITGRDPQLFYNKENKTFYLSITSSGSTYDFICYTSTDFTNWSKHYINLGILTGSRWAPELFYDKDGNIWCTITNDKTIYKAKCNNIELLTFDARTPINLSQQNIIDSSIFYDKEKNKYYLTCKNDDTSLQLIYESSDLENWNLINENVLKSGEKCEGGTIIKVNDKYNFYGDTWNSFGYYIVGQTKDLTNFNSFIRPNSLIGKRHGSVLYLEDEEIISNITKINDFTNLLNINRNPSRELLLNGEIENLVVYPNFTYRLSGTTVINNLINAFDISTFKFYFAGAKNIYIKINNVINSEREIKHINKQFFNSIALNEKLNFISLVGNPVIANSENISKYDKSLITANAGWEVIIYNIFTYKSLVHIDCDVKKIDSSAGTSPFTIPSDFRPKSIYTGITLQNSGYNIRTNGVLTMLNQTINQVQYISCDYLSSQVF